MTIRGGWLYFLNDYDNKQDSSIWFGFNARLTIRQLQNVVSYIKIPAKRWTAPYSARPPRSAPSRFKYLPLMVATRPFTIGEVSARVMS